MHTIKRILIGFVALAVLAGGAYALTPSKQPIPEPLFPVEETGQQIIAYLTGYAPWDNTPPGKNISFAHSWEERAIHEMAGGMGTYEDPITIAVGHSIVDGVSTPDFEPGTRFYIPNVRRYFIVEDVCGDGDTPQDGPCHLLGDEQTQNKATVWLDMWFDGDIEHDDSLMAVECMNSSTGTFWVVKDPLPNYLVDAGPLFDNGMCTQQYGNQAVLQI